MSIAAAFTYLWRRYMGSARYNSILTCESRAMVSELIHPIDIHTTVCLVHSVSKVESGYHHAASLIQRNACSHQRQYVLSRDKQIKSNPSSDNPGAFVERQSSHHANSRQSREWVLHTA